MTSTSTKPDNTNRDSKRLPKRIVTAILSQQDASGAARVSNNFAADALKTAGDIMGAADAWAIELKDQNRPILQIGAAVTTGQIIFGAVGDASRMEVTVIGDAVNLAAKLEKHIKIEEVRALCTASAFENALHQGYRPTGECKKLIGRNIEGVEKPQDIVVIAK